ncbi:MAG TPA: hypothetical protein VGM51_18730 [Armatimonadota bacterium]|jgi:hypothetical protein
MRFFRYLLPAAILAAPTFAATIPVPLDVNALVSKSEATITSTRFDDGDASKVFDADRDSLARTPSINPAFVQVEFKTPQTITGTRVRFTGDKHDWSLTADGKVVFKSAWKSEDPQTVAFPAPLTARVFRLDAKRLEGDDYVHFFDWELLQPGKLKSLTITGPKGDVPAGSVFSLTASGQTADGRTIDVTGDANWTAQGATIWRKPNRFSAGESGDLTATATLDDLSASVKLPVKGEEVRNKDFDLDAMYIERLPRINFDDNKSTGGWPKPGQRVQWMAHLHNWGTRDISAVGYTWVLDGKKAYEGKIRDWKADTDRTVSFPWTWEQSRHSLAFILDSDARLLDESSRGNNQVTIATDALAVGYWVEDGLSRYMHDHQRELGDGANSFEDWGQRQMTLWNQMFANAKYGSSPNGILDRVRLDKVVHVPTGALPLNGGLPTNNPDGPDKTVDLMWGMVTKNLGPGDFWEVKHGGPFENEYGLIHELDHARYLIDSYGFDVHKVAVDSLKLPDGTPMAGSPSLPVKGSVVRYDKYRGMMDSTHYFSEYEAYAWNRIAGQRARKGNQNGPDDIGAYLNEDLPASNVVRFVDRTGKPISGAAVEVHQARGAKDQWYGKTYVQQPDMTFTTDKNGEVTLPRCPFGDKIEHTYGIANSVLLYIVNSNGTIRTAFQEASDFNLEYWRGHKDKGRYEITLDM